MKAIRYIGAVLFLLSFGAFIATLFVGDYTLTESEFKRAINDANHRSLLLPEMENLFGKTFDEPVSIASAFEARVETVNSRLKDQGAWEKVIYTDYTFPIVKAAGTGLIRKHHSTLFLLVFLSGVIGALLYHLPQLRRLPGIKNDHIYHDPINDRGVLAMFIGGFLILFYVVLYWFPEYIVNWVILVDGLSYALRGAEADQWFLYGMLYTLAILVMGVRMLIKYRHSNYHLIRTVSVMFFQTAFAFAIPQLLAAMNLPSHDLKNIWPLDYSFFFDYRIDKMIESGTVGYFMLGWGIVLFAIGVPLFTYLYGKRWYCSWVCGCGGLAETAGDPFRHLSSKKLVAWQIERWMVHGVLVFVVLMTVGVLYTYFTEQARLFSIGNWSISSYDVRGWYGFAIGAAFAGVIGTGFYPFMGNRVWCRFGCPLAAYLGLVQRFKSRFRITTNGGQCISCGNCSTYCEMGIDVRWYAQRGQNIVRSSCVGCGICASVCPRGVLKLENGKDDGSSRTDAPAILIGNDSIKLNV